MLMINIRHNWPERPGYPVVHPKGGMEYVGLHFHDQVMLRYDNTEILAPPGSFIVFSPDITISYQSSQCYRVDKMYIIGNVSDIMRMYSLEPNTLYHPTNGNEITSIMEMLEFEFYVQHSWWYRYVDIKVEELFIMISLNLSYEKCSSMSIELSHRMKSIRQEMMAFPERDWSVGNLASRIGVSESRVYPLYKALFGISPNRDLILIRVEKAKQLLEQGLSLGEAAERSGYSNVYHFIRQFEKQTNFSPHQYAVHARKAKFIPANRG